ncbi:ABC transporter substrate-binding protein [Psychrobacter raelei]|uniref:Oligopeptide ABC transporter substrate-binding protein OppA n=3 Tax=Psychrobacter TaxID=497 RepID=A0A844LYQ4_9GAMM|nr:ABC transporter substrate-binding protein [Psychrobacter sp. PraFG1]MUG31792.1 oligopeptide ABC transporter substrate-binding protein OppA [Psychrobacter sanguinis]UNK05420.1 ABC transporter substrate-binding protein [Psychrobacter sp. PraFG1]
MRKSTSLVNTVFLPTTLALAMMMVGCGDKSASSGSSAKVDPNVLADKQELVINNAAEPESLDPQKVSGVPEAAVIRQMLVGLTTTDRDGKTIPGMAESWESTDNKVWTFKIRDAKWSNGDPVTANDFVYSWRRLLDPNTASPYASYLVDAKVAGAEAIMEGKAAVDSLGVKALDDKTLQVTLSEPVPYFPDTLIHTSVKPVNQKAVEQFGDKWTDPANIVVNGPYKISEWQVNDKIVLTRNESYYDNANTTLEKITMLAIPSSTTDVARYQAGEIDVTNEELPSEQFKSLKEQLGDEVSVSPMLCTYYYEFNTVKPPFNDARVRRALALALDRNTITDKVVGQGQTPAYQLTPVSTNGMENNTPEWQNWDQARRVEEAKKLLNEAGYSESKPLKFELLYNTSDNHKKIAVAASSLWKQSLGFVDVSLINKEWKTYLDTRRNGNYQVARAGWCGDYNEPSTFLNIVKSGNSNNQGKYSSAAFDSLMTQTLKAGVTPEQRANLYKQAEVQLDKDMPNINVYHYVSPRLIKPYVVGFPVNDPLNNWQGKDLKIAKH